MIISAATGEAGPRGETFETELYAAFGMLVAMLLRIDEYTSHAHHGHEAIAG